MIPREEGPSHDGSALVRDFQRMQHEEKLARAGGYIPPNSDPRQCEPAHLASSGDKGGFEYRVTNGATRPFDHCNKIACKVREQCTALVAAELQARPPFKKGDRAIFVRNLQNVHPQLLNGGLFVMPGAEVTVEYVTTGEDGLWKAGIRVGEIVREVFLRQLEKIQ